MEIIAKKDMALPVITCTSPHYILHFQPQKRLTKAEQNLVCEVRLIPGLKLFHFQEYRPLTPHISTCQ